MLSNEGCEKALARIVNDDYYFENDPYGEDKASAFDKDVDMIEQLIEEHFKPKENTSEFKHFKLHSDSTLKNLTKNELIDYIKMLYHNWGVADEQLKRIIDKAKELSNSNDELRRQLYFIEPYNFEDYGYRKLKKYGVHDIRRGKLIYIGFLRDIKEEFFEDKYTLEHIKKVTYSNKLLENRYLIRKDIA